MSQEFRLQLKFWGVRGSMPTPQIDNLKYGGNTSCIEVRLPGGEVFIFDAGSGVRNLGLALEEEFVGHRLSLNVFLTHFHWDHIQGLPFFPPLYTRDNEVTFHSAHPSGSLEAILKGQMANPFFPVNFEFLPARRNIADSLTGPVQFGELSIHPFPLNHPQGAFGYRIEHRGAVLVYATDLEHGDPQLDAVLREYSQDADILVYDAQYTPSEYGSHRGWGHSTWLEATRVAKDANAKQLVLFHHDPGRNDQLLFNLVQEARMKFENTLAAAEGLVLTT